MRSAKGSAAREGSATARTSRSRKRSKNFRILQLSTPQGGVSIPCAALNAPRFPTYRKLTGCSFPSSEIDGEPATAENRSRARAHTCSIITAF
jgi:hypothetical protein